MHNMIQYMIKINRKTIHDNFYKLTKRDDKKGHDVNR